MTKLKDITGKALSGEWGTDDETGVGIPVLRTTNFTNEGIVNYENVVTRIITKKDISEKYLQSGDIIIEKSGGSDKQPVGRVIYFDGPENTYLFNNFTGLLRVRDKNEWFPRYVFYSLFANYKKGGTRPFENKTTGLHNLKTDDYVSRYEITEIPLNKQIVICAQLDQSLKVINLRRKELSNLDDLIKARFVEMFGDPIENPRGYYVATLQDLIEKGFITYHLDGNHGGDYPRSEEFVESGIPYISANCIVHGEIDFAKAKYLTPERAGKLRKGIAQNEDVLFAHNATVGPTVVLHTDEEKVILGTSLTAYRCNQEEIMPNYLKAYMMSNGFVRQYSSEMKQTTRNQVPITAQKKYQFLIPPIEEQKQFTVFVNQIDKSKLLSGCRLFHSWAPENRDKPQHVGVPRRKTKDLRGCRRQQ